MIAGSDRVRILHLRASQFHGGPEKQILHHALRASSSGKEIWLASFRDGAVRPEFLERADKLGLPTIELSSGRFNPRTIFELALAIREKKISLLCTHGYKANLLGWAASRFTGRPQIAFARGWTGENWPIRLYERIERSFLARADWVACVSRPLAEEIGRKRGGRTLPLVIPNCALFPFQNVVLPVDRLSYRENLGIPQNSFCLCAVGRLSPEKGHRYLLQALADLVRTIPRVVLVLLGEGRRRVELEKQATELGVDRQVIFAGFKKDIRPWIQACDLLVNPSLTEGTPNVVLEAMALGTPVIATAVGGVPDLVEHLLSGVLVPPGDSTALAAAIHGIFCSPADRLHLAQNAQKRLLRYSPARQTQQLNELYAKALQSSERTFLNNSAVSPVRGTSPANHVHSSI